MASISGKTASLFATAARIGGLVAGFDRGLTDALTDYGEAYGIVFQIVDDLLDITSTDDQLGKPAGHDMVEGVYTLPVLRTLQAGGVPAMELLACSASRSTRRARQDTAHRSRQRRCHIGVRHRAGLGTPRRSRLRLRCRPPRPPTPCAPRPAALIATVPDPRLLTAVSLAPGPACPWSVSRPPGCPERLHRGRCGVFRAHLGALKALHSAAVECLGVATWVP